MTSPPRRLGVAAFGRRLRLLPDHAGGLMCAIPTPLGELHVEGVDLLAAHRVAEAAGDLADDLRVLEVRGRLDDRARSLLRIRRLEDAAADEHCLCAELHHERRVGRGRDAARGEQRDGQFAAFGDLFDEVDRRAEFLGPAVALLRPSDPELLDVAQDRTQVADRFDDVAGAGLALRADHARAFADASQRFTEVRRAAHERNREGPLVDVVRLVGRCQHFATRRRSRRRATGAPGPRRSGRSGTWPSPGS